MPNVKLHLQPGTGAGHNTAPPQRPASNEVGWLRAKSQDPTSKNWDVASNWWFCYSGGNGPNASEGGTKGGEIDLPTGGNFTVGPSGQEVITSIVINESISPKPNPSKYTPDPPVVGDRGIYTIADTEHQDPDGQTDTFDVYAKFNSASTVVVRCDPIIRNK